MAPWEYKIAEFDIEAGDSFIDLLETSFDGEGKDGWELVSVLARVGTKPSYVAFFKRPKSN